MTLQSSGQIAISDINTEIGQSATYSSDLGFLNGLILPSLRPSQPNRAGFYGLSYFQNTSAGNCNGTGINNCCGNCASGNCPVVDPSNCNCGCGDQGKNCHVCYNCGAVNCANCDSQNWLQTGNCAGACTYNCTSYQCYAQACNCSKIICTKLHEFGLMQKNIFDADQLYGEYLRKNDPKVYEGYIRWASIIVDGMTGKCPDFMFWVSKDTRKQREMELVIKWAHKVATPWSEHMAYLMQAVKKDNDVGRVLMKVGRFVSRLVSYLPKTKKSASLPTIAFTWVIFTSTYYLSSLYVKLTNKINLFTGVKLQ